MFTKLRCWNLKGVSPGDSPEGAVSEVVHAVPSLKTVVNSLAL